LDGIMEKEGPQRLAGCSFHENGHQLLCGLELISVHAIALGKQVIHWPRFMALRRVSAP